MNPAMMDMREVATRLSVSICTVERLVASGELRAVRVRRAVRVTAEALDAYIPGLLCHSQTAGQAWVKNIERQVSNVSS
jgi:excisionase family DNA binding protein